MSAETLVQDYGADREQLLTSADRRALFSTGLTIAVGVLGLIGLVNSFAAVTEALRPSFGSLAWTATLGIDIGIAVFSLLGLALTKNDIRVPWLRFVPWSLIGATIFLNVADQATWIGRVAHAALPMLWVVAVAVGERVLRHQVGLATGKRMDSIRFARWVLAPWPTFKLWRSMQLWEIRSYPQALARERDRVLVTADLVEEYGRRWKRKAPRKTVARYKLGQHAPEGTRLKAITTTTTTSPRKPRKRRQAPLPPAAEAALPTARLVAARLASEGTALTRDVLRGELKAAGHPLSNERLAAVIRVIRSEASS